MWRLTSEGLPLIVVQQPAERLGDDAARSRQHSGCHVGSLQQHCSNEVDALQQLQVDVHVEGHLTPPLQLLLLRRLVLVPLVKQHNAKIACGLSYYVLVLLFAACITVITGNSYVTAQ